MSERRVKRTPEAEDMASLTPPEAFPQSLEEFARTHSPRRDRELMAGFVVHARRQGWTTAMPAEWVTRFEAFRHKEA